ncbi:hypothetical protein EST38_g3345 [Candolleomyces aberdarensis]|uniref:Uncharacterized protein n=1 Tax=Candolleomyces aberdarensis TaxID=2316362 RepID=A0A4Q2DTS1_9AGAR|nr:hypothetical protein EST38_g3345 [Candolleomyces aberdarensis]
MQLSMLSSLLVAALPAAINALRVPNNDIPLFNLVATGCDSCGTDYKFGTVLGSSTNKCAAYSPFTPSSFNENAQLGAMLTFNGTGGLYVCGLTSEVYYKANPDDGPSGCGPISMSTLPATEDPSASTSSGSGRFFLGLL